VLKYFFFALMGISVLVNVAGAVLNYSNEPSVHDGIQTPTPTASPTISPTPIPTPCYPDDPKKPCPTPTPDTLPTTSPTILP
jgi:mannan endo-1,4-beta-mannosidase